MLRSIISAAVVAALATVVSAASVSSVSVGSNSGEFGGMRIRYGATGSEVYVGNANLGSSGNRAEINYGGAPVWSNGATYDFAMSWNSTTGVVSGSTSAGSQVASFGMPTFASYGPTNIYLRLQGNLTQVITLSDLKVNGVPVSGISTPGLTPTAANEQALYKISGVGGPGFTSLTGKFRFAWSGNTSQERPVVNIMMADAVQATVIPLPAAAWAGLALLGVGGAIRRRIA
jgi:hypothetical protein